MASPVPSPVRAHSSLILQDEGDDDEYVQEIPLLQRMDSLNRAWKKMSVRAVELLNRLQTEMDRAEDLRHESSELHSTAGAREMRLSSAGGPALGAARNSLSLSVAARGNSNLSVAARANSNLSVAARGNSNLGAVRNNSIASLANVNPNLSVARTNPNVKTRRLPSIPAAGEDAPEKEELMVDLPVRAYGNRGQYQVARNADPVAFHQRVAEQQKQQQQHPPAHAQPVAEQLEGFRQQQLAQHEQEDMSEWRSPPELLHPAASWAVPASVVYRTVDDVARLYQVIDKLGRGGFATVYKGRSRERAKEYALKVLSNKMFRRHLQLVENEVQVLAAFDHHRLVRLQEVISTERYVCLVVELVRGGDMFDYIVKLHGFSERVARDIFFQVAEGVDELHRGGVMHRDLKPENLLVDVLVRDLFEVKITDFGLARFLSMGEVVNDGAGTAQYSAPEVHKRLPVGLASDVWSLGVVLYMMLCGFPPFFGETRKEMRDSILFAPLEFPSAFWSDVSPTARDLVTRMLERDESKRLTIKEVRHHPWLRDGSMPHNVPLNKAQHELMRFNATRKFRRAVFAAVAKHRVLHFLEAGEERERLERERTQQEDGGSGGSAQDSAQASGNNNGGGGDNNGAFGEIGCDTGRTQHNGEGQGGGGVHARSVANAGGQQGRSESGWERGEGGAKDPNGAQAAGARANPKPQPQPEAQQQHRPPAQPQVAHQQPQRPHAPRQPQPGPQQARGQDVFHKPPKPNRRGIPARSPVPPARPPRPAHNPNPPLASSHKPPCGIPVPVASPKPKSKPGGAARLGARPMGRRRGSADATGGPSQGKSRRGSQP